MTLAGLSRAIAEGDLSPVEATRRCLDRIERLDPRLNAFLTVTADQALVDAARAEAEIRAGRRRGPLHGVPVAVKDLFETRGVRTTAGSVVLRGWVPGRDAAVVRRLNEAGAVLLGKLNMSEFAYGAIHPEVGPVRNPWNLDRFTGGSSSGSAAALAAGLCYGSAGTDTGGSIRGPAAHCAVVGFKPTRDLVSREGVVPLSWTLDHAGPMARTVEDVSILFRAIAEAPPEAAPDVRTLRVGAVAFPGTQPDVAARVRAAVETLGSLARSVEDVALPLAAETVPAWTTICMAEASAYHQRWLAERPHDYSAPLRDRLLAGLGVPAVQYLQARRVRRVIARGFAELFTRVDVLALPTILAEAPTIEAAMAGSWESMLDRLRAFAPFNLAGLPAVSVPCGLTGSGLPVGLQIAGPHLSDWTVLAAASAYEQAANLRLEPPFG